MTENAQEHKILPSSASISSPGNTFSSSEYSASEMASGLTSSTFFSFSSRNLPSQPLLLRGVLGVSWSAESVGGGLSIEMCGGCCCGGGGGVVSVVDGIVRIC